MSRPLSLSRNRDFFDGVKDVAAPHVNLLGHCCESQVGDEKSLRHHSRIQYQAIMSEAKLSDG
jgi:hypothetical protein